MKPYKILLFVFCILASLLGFTFVSKSHMVYNQELEIEEEIQGFKLGQFYIKYPTFKEISTFSTSVTNDKAQEILAVKKDTILVDTIQVARRIDTLNCNVEGRIYYPKNPDEFVLGLHRKLSQDRCRIVHYGASKNEGDRITSYIRDGLQEMYGGTGPGYFPIKTPYPQKSIDIKTKGTWFRYALFNKEHRKTKNLLPNNQYGMYANSCRFTPVGEKDLTSIKKASFTISPTKKFHDRLKSYDLLEIHYGNCKKSVKISIFENSKLIKEDTLISDGKYHNYKVDFMQTPAEVRVEFSGVESPDFYGITLGSKKGVQMDNVPTRGDAGLHFTKLQDTFDEMTKELSPDIYIFEFGGNLVPWMKNEEQVKKNVNELINNILWVKKRNPNAQYLLVGPSDMLSRNTKNSYKILPILVKEMKTQALENDIAFWSMYEAMGGANSMKIWFDNGFGASDFIHFSDKGTQKISELFFDVIKQDLLLIQKLEKENLLH